MVQEFHVVLCFSCRTFQVHQVKKASSRWRCSLCGEKQSLLKEFGRGSSRDCRHHVQKLNSMRGAVMQEEESNPWSLWKQMEANGEDVEEQREKKQSQVESCWSKYLDMKEEVVLEEQEDRPAGAHLHRKRRREESTPEQSDGPKLKKTETCAASKDWTGTSTPSVTGTSVTGTSTPSVTRTSVTGTSTPSVTRTSTPSVTGTSTPSVTGTSVTGTSTPSVTGTSNPSVTGTSVTRTSTPSVTGTSNPSVTGTSTPSVTGTSVTRTSVTGTSVGSSPGSRWAPFLTWNCVVEHKEEACGSGTSQWSCSSGGWTRSHTSSLRGVSIFDTGEDFDEFLPADH